MAEAEEQAEDFWYRLYAEACRRGLGSLAVVLVVVLGDGAEWIWRYAGQFVGIGQVQVVEIVEIFHAFEHLWTVANAVFGAGSAKAEEWVNPLKRQLEEQVVRPARGHRSKGFGRSHLRTPHKALGSIAPFDPRSDLSA